MSQPQQEKRATRRFSLRLPVSIRFTNGGVQEFSAETRDVSARGVFFYIDKRLSEALPLNSRSRCRRKSPLPRAFGCDVKAAWCAWKSPRKNAWAWAPSSINTIS